MQAYDYGAEKLPDDSIDPRDYRALTRSLTVLPDYGRAAGAADLYMVVSDSGSEYLVDARDGVCECPDHEYRGVECLHLRRVAFATGAREVPGEIDRDDVDDQLGIHVDAEPVFATAVATDGGEIVEAGDEGAILEREPDVEYSSHIEPPAQGGERYARCEACGAELLTRLGGAEKMIHREGCPAGEYR